MVTSLTPIYSQSFFEIRQNPHNLVDLAKFLSKTTVVERNQNAFKAVSWDGTHSSAKTANAHWLLNAPSTILHAHQLNFDFSFGSAHSLDQFSASGQMGLNAMQSENHSSWNVHLFAFHHGAR